MKRRSLLDGVRIALYVVLLSFAAYLVWRYDLVRLPSEGCSPLVGFAPGDRLVVERRALRGPVEGDAVLYRTPTESLLLGRVKEPPPSAPAAYWEAVAAGAFWVVNERPDCPGEDSRRFGPIPPADVWGRVAFTLPW